MIRLFALFLIAAYSIGCDQSEAVYRTKFDNYNDSCTKYLCLFDCASKSGKSDSAHYYLYAKSIPFNDSIKYYYSMLYPIKPLIVSPEENKKYKCNRK